ncbi:hypothetical protein [Tenacibaculum sp.]|uniref:hypothetical protein n=1 Tax=Tenacibaculum sp. TaxID=1906242 RepID=UPI003D13BF45
MKKSILNLGKALNKVEQIQINGGKPMWCGYCQCELGPIYACGVDQRSACLNVCAQ